MASKFNLVFINFCIKHTERPRDDLTLVVGAKRCEKMSDAPPRDYLYYIKVL